MIDHALESAFADFIQSDATFDGTKLYTAHDDETHVLPAIIFAAKSEPLSGSSDVFRAEMTITIQSEAHDSSPEAHEARVELLLTKLADKASAAAAINAAGKIHLYGYAPSATDPNVDASKSKFCTPLIYKVGYGTAR